MGNKATHQTDRQTIKRFDQIINIGKAMAGDFERLGFQSPQALIGQDPLVMYQAICQTDNLFHDPCVLDVFMATVDYMNGGKPKSWWSFTKERKRRYTADVDLLRGRYSR